MWVEAIVSRDDFAALTDELLPLTIHLGEAESEHYVRLKGPAQVSLVQERGLRIKCSADVHWPVLGMEIPIHVESFTVLLTPSVPTDGDALVVSMQVEDADVAWVPAILDARIVEAINAALHKKSAELSWHFAETLSHRFGLPPFLQPLYGLDLTVAWGKVRTTNEAMVLAVSFQARAIRADDRALESARRELRRGNGNGVSSIVNTRASSNGVSAAAVAVGTALGLMTTFLAFRGAYRLLGGGHTHRSRAHF